MKQPKERNWYIPPDVPLNETHKQQLEEISNRNKHKPNMRGVYRR
jgi:hypothetical protein